MTDQTNTKNEEGITMEIDAPWGHTKHKPRQWGEFFKYTLLQLVSYKNDGRVPSQSLLDDIEGYTEIVNSSDADANGAAFMKMKEILKDKKSILKSNIDIVNVLKEAGEWV